MMLEYDWPGNVRELANAMEYAWIVSGGTPITSAHLPHDVRNPAARQPAFASYTPPATLPFPQPAANFAAPLPAANGSKTLEDVEMEYILQVYAKNGGNKQATATELGISLKTLYNKLHKFEEDRRRKAG